MQVLLPTAGPLQLMDMTRRKPAGVRFETWIDRQVREAAQRGEFDDLPGHGEPLPDLGRPHDEMWWVKRKLRRENLSYLPPSLALRKEAHDAVEGATQARTEAEVRDRIAAINEKIRDAIRMGVRGPEVMLRPIDVEQVVRDWRQARDARRTGET